MQRLWKLIFAILVISSPLFAQNSQKQGSTPSLLDHKISVNLSDVSIGEVLREISAKDQINFSYLNHEIPLEKLVNVHLSDTQLRTILDSIFKNTFVHYYPISKQVVLKLEAPEETITTDTIVKTPDSLTTINSKPKETDSTYIIAGKVIKGQEKKRAYLSVFSYDKNGFGNDFIEKVITVDTLVTETSSEVTGQKTVKKKLVRRAKYVRRPDEPFTKGFVIGAFVTPAYSYRNLKNASDINEKGVRNKAEYAKFRLSAGISVKYFFRTNFFIGSGVQLTNFGENGSYIGYKQVEEQIQPGQGNSLKRIDSTISYTNRYNYIGIPVLVGYKTNTRLSVGFSTGVILNELLSHSTNYPEKSSTSKQEFPPSKVTYFYYRPELDEKTHKIRQFNLCFMLNTEISYPVSNRIAISIAPNFCYSLSSIYSNNDKTSSHPYLFGVSGGLNYNLFKK